MDNDVMTEAAIVWTCDTKAVAAEPSVQTSLPLVQTVVPSQTGLVMKAAGQTCAPSVTDEEVAEPTSVPSVQAVVPSQTGLVAVPTCAPSVEEQTQTLDEEVAEPTSVPSVQAVVPSQTGFVAVSTCAPSVEEQIQISDEEVAEPTRVPSVQAVVPSQTGFVAVPTCAPSVEEQTQTPDEEVAEPTSVPSVQAVVPSQTGLVAVPTCAPSVEEQTQTSNEEAAEPVVQTSVPSVQIVVPSQTPLKLVMEAAGQAHAPSVEEQTQISDEEAAEPVVQTSLPSMEAVVPSPLVGLVMEAAEPIVQSCTSSAEWVAETQTPVVGRVVEAAESIVQTSIPSVATPGDQDLTQLPVVLASLAVSLLLIILIVVIRRRGSSSSKGSQILLTGPSDAGKTVIHSTLVFGQSLPSHTSLQTNTSIITLPADEKQTRPVTLVDIPGHPRIRDQFKEHLYKTKAIVFVVDSSTISRHGASVAEHLHHILHAITSLPPSQTPPSLVILAHKYDLLSSSGSPLAVSRVRTILERELEKRRASSVARLGDDDDDVMMGGLACTTDMVGSAFKFKHWEGGEIEILGSCVGMEGNVIDSEKASGDGLRELKQWLQALP